jgi:hypothetical protein
MMKKLLMSIWVLALSASVIAGGDDRDRGPVESLDAIASPTQTNFISLQPSMINNFIKKCAQSKLSSICDELLELLRVAMTVIEVQ